MATRRSLVLKGPALLWLIVSMLLALGCVGAIVSYALQKTPHQWAAEEQGQRLIISLETGEVVSRAVKSPWNAEKKLVTSAVKDKIPSQPSTTVEKTPLPTGKVPASITIPTITPQAATQQPPAIAILIMGLGLSSSTTENSLQLPRQIAMGFSPYAYSIKEWAQKAALIGHEVFVNIPMEPANYPVDVPGPYALLTELSDQENNKRLNWILSRIEGYVGVYSQPGEKFSYTLRNIRLVLDRLKERNVLFVYGGGEENSALQQVTKELQLPFAMGDILIDEDISSSAIEQRLAELENIARKNGYAIAIGNPYPVTVKLLTKWVAELETKGIQLVPFTTLVQKTRYKQDVKQ